MARFLFRPTSRLPGPRLGTLLLAVLLLSGSARATPSTEQSILRAVKLAQHRDHDGAIHILRGLLAQNPDNPHAHRYLGRNLQLVGRFDEALIEYDAALRLQLTPAERTDTMALRKEAEAEKALANSQPGEAAKLFAEAHALKPRPRLLLAQARCRHQAHRLTEAIALYQEYLATTPPDRNQVRSLMEQARQEQATEHSDSAQVATDPNQEQPGPSPQSAQPAQGADPGDYKPAPLMPISPTPVLVVQRVDHQDRVARPIYQRWWLWTVIGVGVAAAVTIPLAVVYSSPADPLGNVARVRVSF